MAQGDDRSDGSAWGVVLAAGAGSRFGGGKLLAACRGEPLATHAVRAALTALDEVVVVTGADGAAVAAAARRAAQGRRLRVVAAEDWALGLSASLRAGLAALPPQAGAAVVFLADMPNVPPAIVPALVEAWGCGAAAASPVHAGRRGHPTLISRALFPQVMALTGDRGAGALLDGLGPALARLETDDPGVLFDVDVREDLR